jgi:Tfp pilus assembly protein PilV
MKRFRPYSLSLCFTLIEIMIAAFILSVAILGLSVTLLSLINLHHLTKENNYALSQAKQMMEQIRAEKFDTIFDTYATLDFPVSNYLNVQKGDTDNNVGKILVSKVAGNDNLLEITITLDWQARSGHNRQLIFRSRLAKNKNNSTP